MTQRRKKHQLPERRGTGHAGPAAGGAIDRRVLGSTGQFWIQFSLLAVCGLLLLAVIVVFGQTATHNFVNYDDEAYIYDNWHVKEGWTSAGAAWAITTFYASNWHPLTWLSHILDCRLYGLQPAGHHLTNVLLHAATAVLLFLALRRMTGRLWPSAWVAAVFAIHPLRVESVAWAAERKDVLSGLFFMLTLWFYARYAERPASWGRYLLVVASFALGLTAKPMLVTLPFVLLLLDYWPLGRAGSRERGAGSKERGAGSREQGAGSRFVAINRPPTSDSLVSVAPTPRSPLRAPRSRLVEKIPLLVLAAASCAVTVAAQRGAISSLEKVPFPSRVANAAVACVAYLGKMLYPGGLAVPYPLSKDPLPAWEVVLAVAVLLAISTAVFVVRGKCPYLLFGWLWYLGTLVPVIGLMQVGSQSMADRYTYLTQIGLYLAIAWGVADLSGSRRYLPLPVAAFSALVLGGLLVCAWQQTRYWRNGETLLAHTLDCTSRNYLAHYLLGLDLVNRGEVDAGIDHYRRALEYDPDFAEAHNNLGIALAGREHFEEAISHYEAALKIRPRYAEAHYNLAYAMYRCGNVDDGITHFQSGLEIEPDDAKAHYALGIMLAARERAAEAMAHYQRALELASKQNDRALMDAIRAQIKLQSSDARSQSPP